MNIVLGIACGALVLLLIFVALLYKEAKNNVLQIESEKEEARVNFTKTIQEKDSEIQMLMNSKDELNSALEIQKNDFESRINSASANNSDAASKALIDASKKEADAAKAELEDYKKLTTELIKDMHELEDKYISNGGNLSDIYTDYNNYYDGE